MDDEAIKLIVGHEFHGDVMLQRINSYANIYKVCPMFNYDKIISGQCVVYTNGSQHSLEDYADFENCTETCLTHYVHLRALKNTPFLIKFYRE